MYKPRCYGSPTAFSVVGDTCFECPHSVECGEQAIGRLIAIAQTHEIGDVLTNTRVPFLSKHPKAKFPIWQLSLTRPTPFRGFGRLKRRELTDNEIKQLAAMPVKVAKRMRPLMRAGIYGQIKSEIQQGRNPFLTEENHFLRFFADMLLKHRLVKKSVVGLEFAKAYSWTPETAASHVSVAIAVFESLDLVERSENQVKLKV